MEKVMVFDTETVSLEKPFCYNVGYVIADIDERKIIKKNDFVVEQVWHNDMLYSTAYYAEKKPIYVKNMRARKTLMEKFGYVTQQIIRDIKAFDIKFAYAYNSPFDERVFSFNCDWFKTNNPFDNVKILDIRGFAHNYICFNQDYKDFCEKYSLFTESGNYSSTAESLFKFISNKTDFEEAHTALADSEIETNILFNCLDKGAKYDKEYKVYNSIPRLCDRYLTIKDKINNEETIFKYNKKRMDNKRDTIILS